jgi:uncharacterized membrane protein
MSTRPSRHDLQTGPECRDLTVTHSSVFVTTFLAVAVEVIEMVIIVVGVGSVRGWRSTWLGAGGGLAVLAVLVLAAGTALTAVPIGVLRLVVGSLLLVPTTFCTPGALRDRSSRG